MQSEVFELCGSSARLKQKINATFFFPSTGIGLVKCCCGPLSRITNTETSNCGWVPRSKHHMLSDTWYGFFRPLTFAERPWLCQQRSTLAAWRCFVWRLSRSENLLLVETDERAENAACAEVLDVWHCLMVIGRGSLFFCVERWR